MVEPKSGAGWPLALRAAEQASLWHADEKHKDEAPFINHLIEVAALVTTATAGRDPLLATAAFLHDAVEKANIAPGQIRNSFGEEVCTLVLEVTDERGMPKDKRSRKQAENAAQKSQRAKMLKLADKTSNLRALAREASNKDDACDYAEWAEAVAKELRGSDPWLEGQLHQALFLLRQRIGASTRRRTPTSS